MRYLRGEISHEVSGQRVIGRRNVVLDDLPWLRVSSVQCNMKAELTALNAVNAAMHRAFEPHILNSEN